MFLDEGNANMLKHKARLNTAKHTHKKQKHMFFEWRDRKFDLDARTHTHKTRNTERTKNMFWM